MGKMHRYTDEDRRTVRRLYPDGDLARLARRIGVTRCALIAMARRMGLHRSAEARRAQWAAMRDARPADWRERLSLMQREAVERDRRRVRMGLKPLGWWRLEDVPGKVYGARRNLKKRGYLCVKGDIRRYWWDADTRRVDEAAWARRYGFTFEADIEEICNIEDIDD